MPAGLPKVEVSFLINADGILIVNAKELRSGVEQRIEIKPQYGLTDVEVETMLLDSITYAKDDIAKRESLGYVERAPTTNKQCGNCNLWLPPVAGDDCGKCQLFKGPVPAFALCTYWAPKIK